MFYVFISCEFSLPIRKNAQVRKNVLIRTYQIILASPTIDTCRLNNVVWQYFMSECRFAISKRCKNAVKTTQIKRHLSNVVILYQQTLIYNQGGFISEMEWASLNRQLWNTYHSIAKLTISCTRGVSSWERPCY